MTFIAASVAINNHRAAVECGERIAAPGGIEIGGAGADHCGSHVGQQNPRPWWSNDLAAERGFAH